MLATPTEAARQLGISRQTLYKKLAAGNLDSVKRDGRTFVTIPDDDGAPRTVAQLLANCAELPAARAAQADAEATLASMLDRLNELRRLLQPGRHISDNIRVHNELGGFDSLAGEVDAITIELATQRAKVLRCRLRVAELVRDAVTPSVTPARNTYDSLRASLAEAGSVLQDLQSTAESARRDCADLQYQLRTQLA